MSHRVFVTTTDNPYDPSTDFINWFMFDEVHGYHTCALLARVSFTSSSLSDRTNTDLIEQAIDEIIRFNGSDLYKKIVIDDNKSSFFKEKDKENNENDEK